MTANANPTCASCGAPDDGQAVICRFCQKAISAEILARAIPCPNPQCRTQNRYGRQKCGACQAWVVVSCVFCGSLSPCNVSNCLQCNEAFAGAMQRKQAAQSQQQHANNMQSVGTWGNVAAAFAGAVVGAELGSLGSGGSFYESDSYSSNSDTDDYNDSNVSDDTSGDDGGSW